MDEINRGIYARQIMLPELGVEGQERLINASVLIAGAGGLGSIVSMYLAAMGIGRLGLLDNDVVSLSNLNRQLLYTQDDLEQRKVDIAERRLQNINPSMCIEKFYTFFCQENAMNIISGYDIIVDCFDNLLARFVLNDACIELNLPFVHGGVFHLYGQVMTVVPRKTPCLRCILPKQDDNAFVDPKFKGIIGPTAGVIASLEAMMVYKFFTGLPVDSGKMLLFDGMSMAMQSIGLEIKQDCRCQDNKK